MKALWIVLLFFSTLFAEDYTEMSTQELLAIAGYVVDEKDAAKLESELANRAPKMTPKQKTIYQQYLKKKQKK